MRPKDVTFAQNLEVGLCSFDSDCDLLPGISDGVARDVLVEQLVESVRRIKYVSAIRKQNLSSSRANPSSDLFDPIKAAALRMREGREEDAFWLVFLSVHFGKHRHSEWQLARDVYGRLGRPPIWDWNNISAHPNDFRRWLQQQQGRLKSDGIPRHFGNHRKYQSLDARSPTGTGAAFETYVEWVGPPRTHRVLFEHATAECGQNPKAAFDYLYRSMRNVASFGRTARFDYLTMVGKLGLAVIEPDALTWTVRQVRSWVRDCYSVERIKPP